MTVAIVFLVIALIASTSRISDIPKIEIESNISKSELASIHKVYGQFSGYAKYDYILREYLSSRDLLLVENVEEADAIITLDLYDAERKYMSYRQIKNVRIPIERTMKFSVAEFTIEMKNFNYWVAKSYCRQRTILPKWDLVLEKILESCPFDTYNKLLTSRHRISDPHEILSLHFCNPMQN